MTQNEIKIKKSRLAFIYFCILGVFCLVILRMFFVVLIGDKSKVRGIYDTRKSSQRGNIYDRNKVLIATDLKTKSLYVSSVLVKDAMVIASGLAGIFPELSYQEILKKISDGKNSKQWILIRRNLTPLQVEEVKKLRFAGLLFEDDMIRVYPQKSIASHYVGYVDLDRKGLSGIEMQYDQVLVQNQDLYLAMDIRVQDILSDELNNGFIKYKAKAAAGVVMDVNTGEVLALASIPSFDANVQSEALADQRFNRVVSGVYELGSVMKIFTNALAFEKELVKMNDIYSVSEPIKYGRFTIKDHDRGDSEMSVLKIFTESSNIGTVKISEKIGVSNQKEFLTKLGFLKKLEIDFPGVGRPIYPKIWRDINLYTISYGHGLAITPLHLARAVSAIVNGGYIRRISFLKTQKAEEGEAVITEKTSQTMRYMMRKVVEEGTGRNANIVGYEVGGKTGTAERAEYGGYNERQNLVSFVAVFPSSKPQYLVYVIYDRPNYIFNTAGMVATPVAGTVVKNIAPLLGVKPKINQ